MKRRRGIIAAPGALSFVGLFALLVPLSSYIEVRSERESIHLTEVALPYAAVSGLHAAANSPVNRSCEGH